MLINAAPRIDKGKYNERLAEVQADHKRALDEVYEKAKADAGNSHSTELQKLREESGAAVEQVCSPFFYPRFEWCLILFSFPGGYYRSARRMRARSRHYRHLTVLLSATKKQSISAISSAPQWSSMRLAVLVSFLYLFGY
jgi:hypothetical protein